MWLALWMLGWLLLEWLISQSPPVDNAEQLSWVRSLEWGYYKHPPLPTALLWPLVQVFGLHEGVTYLAAGLVTGASLLLSRRLVTDLCGSAIANRALLGTLCIGYYTHRLNYFNHDVLLMVCVVAAAWFCRRAFQDRSHAAWVAVGVALGVGALAKYQVALAAASVFVWWILQQGWRDRLHRRGLLWAAAVALLIFSPHAYWMITHDFLPVHYAVRNSMAQPLTLGQCSVGALRWIGDQIGQLAGALLLGAGLLLWSRRSEPLAPKRDEAAGDMSLRQARAFLICWGLLPLVLMPVIALVFNAKLHLNWGNAFMPLTCAALMACFGTQAWERIRPRDAVVGFALVQAVLVAVSLSKAAGPAPVFNQHRSQQFASQRVADAIGPPARLELGGPIRVIAGSQRLVSVLALRLPERPMVMVDGRSDYSPWLPRDMASLCGILWVGGPGEQPPYESRRHEFGEGLWWAVEPLSHDREECRQRLE